MPNDSFLPLPSEVNEAVGYFGGIGLWFIGLIGDSFLSNFLDVLSFMIVFEIAVVSLRALLRMFVLGLGARFAKFLWSDFKEGLMPVS